MLIHNILRKKYPPTSLVNKEIYFDIHRNRYHDFSKILNNLRNHANDFIPDQNVINRICQLCEGYKESANDMTHSLYHVAKKRK
jgi:hypothetical protein